MTGSAGDRVLRPTRVVAFVIVPFLLLAFAVLVPVPTDTTTLFAWPLKPTMSAMVLGSVYLGGAYFFVRVGFAARWHSVAGGFVPVGLFATLMGITTIVHWNRFVHDRLAFWLWVGLYFTTPFLVFAVFLRNRRESRPAEPGALELPGPAAGGIAVAGALSLATCGFLYLFPARAIAIWPWPLTPLTARMLGAVFVLGVAGLGTVRERRWSAARTLLQVAAIMLALLIISAVRAHDEFDPDKVLTWLFALGFPAALVATVILYTSMERAARLSADPNLASEPNPIDPGIA